MPFIYALVAFAITAGTTGSVWLSLIAYVGTLYVSTNIRQRKDAYDTMSRAFNLPPRISVVRYLFLKVKNRRRA